MRFPSRNVPLFISNESSHMWRACNKYDFRTIISKFSSFIRSSRAVHWWYRSGKRQPKTYVKPEAAITVFELLMMGDVLSETCWAIKKHCNNKFYYTVASCWYFYEIPIPKCTLIYFKWLITYVACNKYDFRINISKFSSFVRSSHCRPNTEK